MDKGISHVLSMSILLYGLRRPIFNSQDKEPYSFVELKAQEKTGLLLMPTAKVTKNVSAAEGGGNVLCSILISIKTKAWLYSFLPCGFYALKISFQFLARKKAFFPVRFSLVLYVFYSRQLGFLFKICGSLVFVSCQGKRSYSSSMPYSLSRPANSSTSSRACSYVTSNSSVSRRAISSSVKPPFSIICQM